MNILSLVKVAPLKIQFFQYRLFFFKYVILFFSRSTLSIELQGNDEKEALNYAPGDRIGVFPGNPPELVMGNTSPMLLQPIRLFNLNTFLSPALVTFLLNPIHIKDITHPVGHHYKCLCCLCCQGLILQSMLSIFSNRNCWYLLLRTEHTIELFNILYKGYFMWLYSRKILVSQLVL